MQSQDARWVNAVANDLSGVLHQISGAAHALQQLCADNPQAQAPVQALLTNIERAKQVTDLMLATSEPGAPIPEVPAATGLATGYAAEIANPDGPNELILIVDDENFVTLLAQRVLVEEGYKVLIANDGFEALKIYQELKNQIALVVLDFTMPVMDGSEVFDELRRIKPDVVVMVSSGFTEQERLKAMLAKGLKGFLPKPYTKQKLVMQIRSVLDMLKR